MEKRNGAAMASQHTERKKYETVVAFLQDGYGPGVSIALMDCVERYLPSFVKDGCVPSDDILRYHWMLCSLLKAVMKDEYGVDLEGAEEQEGGEDSW